MSKPSFQTFFHPSLRSPLLLLFTVIATTLLAGNKIDVAEKTFKIPALKEEVFYYGLAEGDILVFDFVEVNGRELKEIEIVEMPSSSKFMEFKTAQIANKNISIQRTGVYKFRFSNSAATGRVCKVHIQRIPASAATLKFNTSVYWRTKNDTTYKVISEKYLNGYDTAVVHLTDQVAKVHSRSNLNGNRTSFNFSLPDHTVAWSYYIGVDQEGQKAYEQAVTQLANKAAFLVAKIPGYGPTAALALGSISYLSAIQTGEDIDYYFVSGDNANLFLNEKKFKYIKKGKVINDFSRMLKPTKGSYHLCLYNDNAVNGVNVFVKITAITVKERWKEKTTLKMEILTPKEPYLKN